jgi:hypothetical protein
MFKNIMFALKPTLEKRKILLNKITIINHSYVEFSIDYNEDIPGQFDKVIQDIRGYAEALAKLGDGGLLLQYEFVDIVNGYEDFLNLIENVLIHDTIHWHKPGAIPNVVPKDSGIANYDPFKNLLAVESRNLFAEHILTTAKASISNLHLISRNYKPSKDLLYRLK